MNSHERQVREELERLLSALGKFTGLRSNWNGALEIVPNAAFKGKKPFSCGILIDEALVGQEIRWRTLIHECLHALSVGYVKMEYDEYPGWEEGVVEQLQRLLRPRLFSELGLAVAEDQFRDQETSHLYNGYIAALEEVRQKLEQPEVPFYISLLSTPIKNRPGFVVSLGRQLPADKRNDFLRSFSRANAVLKDETIWLPTQTPRGSN